MKFFEKLIVQWAKGNLLYINIKLNEITLQMLFANVKNKNEIIF